MTLTGAGRAPAYAVRALAAGILTGLFAINGAAANPCPYGTWADVMLGAYHVHPDKHFEDFDPGIGVECQFKPQWAASAGYFRNSLLRPSFYAGAVYAPDSLRWGPLRLGAMGGVISGYNYGRFGIGENHRTGLVLVPSAILNFGRFGANILLVPPIAADHLPLTIGLQAKLRLK
jgi:hypothetical protein